VCLVADGFARRHTRIQWNSIHSNQAERLGRVLEEDCEVEVGDGGGVEHSPELLLAGFDLDRCGRVVGVRNGNVINREVFGGLSKAGAVIGGITVPINEELREDGFRLGRRGVGIQEILVANDEDALGKAGELSIDALDAFDDKSARLAAKELLLTESMDMRVIPIESRRLVDRNAEAVLEGRIAGLDEGLEDIVLMAGSRNGEAMKMKIGGNRPP
jgi:hypothetical protein